jgi:protein SCO1/2
VTAVVAVLLAAAASPLGEAGAIPATARPPILQQVNFEQRLDQPLPLDLRFRDEAGKMVRLRELFRGRPVLLTLAYYRCPMLCPMVLNGTVRAMNALPLELGRDYDVVTVSFDPHDDDAAAAAKRAEYRGHYNRADAAFSWRFLTGEAESIRRLTEAVGFRSVHDPARDQFAHAAAIVVVTPEGRIARYFYGIDYSARDLRLGLVEASQGKIGSLADQLLLFCFHYDPSTGRYSTMALGVVRIGGVLTVVGLVAFVAVLRRRENAHHA